MKIKGAALFALGILGAGSAQASTMAFTNQGEFLAQSGASAKNINSAAAIDGQLPSLQSASTNFAANCVFEGTCFSATPNAVFIGNADNARRCSNIIPDVSSAPFSTCLFDQAQAAYPSPLGDSPDNYYLFAQTSTIPDVSFKFDSSTSAIGFDLTGSYLPTLFYDINGQSGSIDIGRHTFAGFAGDGPLSGTISFRGLARIGQYYENEAGAVPEPATWAMMIMGFGMIGFGMRKSNAKVDLKVKRIAAGLQA